MADMNLYEELDAFREIIAEDDHAIVGLGRSKKRDDLLFDQVMSAVGEIPDAPRKFGPPQPLEEQENRSDAETVFFFNSRDDALRIYSEGMALGLASGEITFDPTVEIKYGVGRYAVRFAPHVREAKREVLYTLYALASDTGTPEELPTMFNEWMKETGGALVVEAGTMMSPGDYAQIITAKVPSGRLKLDHQGGNGTPHRKATIARGKRSHSRFDRAARATAPPVDTSAAQVPVEGKTGYSHPDPEMHEDKSYERAKKKGYTGIYFLVDTSTGKAVEGPFKGVNKADKAQSKRGKGFQVINKEYLNPQAYRHLKEDDLEEGFTGHHAKIGGKYYVDTAFMNAIGNTMPGFSMEHMGFGEFVLKGPDGETIDFDRMRGRDFEGQSGRSHQIYDNQGGKLVKKLIKEMERKKLSTLVEDEDRLDERRGMPVSRGVERAALLSKLKKQAKGAKGSDEEEKKGKKKSRREDEDEDDRLPLDERRGMPVSRGVERAAMLSKLKKQAKGEKEEPGDEGKKKKKGGRRPQCDDLATELTALLGEEYVEELHTLIGD